MVSPNEKTVTVQRRGPTILTCYNFRVSDSNREEITSRVIRNGFPEPTDNDWSTATPEERIEAVWTPTKLCWGWNDSSSSEPRMQRTVTRVQRGRSSEATKDLEQ